MYNRDLLKRTVELLTEDNVRREVSRFQYQIGGEWWDYNYDTGKFTQGEKEYDTVLGHLITGVREQKDVVAEELAEAERQREMVHRLAEEYDTEEERYS